MLAHYATQTYTGALLCRLQQMSNAFGVCAGVLEKECKFTASFVEAQLVSDANFWLMREVWSGKACLQRINPTGKLCNSLR